MIYLFILIIICYLIANEIQIKSLSYESVQIAKKNKLKVRMLYWMLLILIIMFSGLRTSYNDTGYYLLGFKILDVQTITYTTIFEPYGGFEIFQGILKKYISENPQILIITSSIIVNSIYMWFFSKYSKYFGLTVFSYFILGPYLFSMAGLKQIIAMSICLFAIDNLLKNKMINFFIWVLISMTFHPYIICMLILPILKNKILNKKMIFAILLVAVLVLNLDALLNLASFIGKDYTTNEITANTINPFRVVVESIPVILVIIKLKRLRLENNTLLNLGINSLIVNFFFISLGLLFNPIYFGRIATYFSSINAVVIPMMLVIIFKNTISMRINILAYYAIYIIYFVLDITKLGSISIFEDIFKHIGPF